MNKEILNSLNVFNNEQSKRLIAFFKKIHGKCDGRQYPQIITCLNAVYKKEHTDKELEGIITDGDGDGGFADAIVFQKDSFDIFDFKESSNLGLRDIQKFRERLNALIFPPSPEEFVYDGTDCFRIKKHLEKIHSPKNKRSKCNIFIIREKFSTFSEPINKEITKIKNNPGVEIFFIDNEKIVNLLLEQDFLKKWLIKKSNIDILSNKKVLNSVNEYEFLILKISLSDLLKLYKDHIDRKKDLFGQNIRLPKRAEKFSSGISKTVREKTENFFLFHNGITITANGISANATCFITSEPQVVNGAQTLGNLYEKYNHDLNNKQLKKAKVLCKIIKADQDLTDLICETSNTQKAVKVEDLRTNDSFQKKLEIYIKSESKGKYKYERKGGKTEKNIVSIKYVKFFQWTYSALLFEPAKAKNAKQRLFEKDDRGEYEKIKTTITENLSKIIFLCDVGIFVENRIKEEKEKDKKGFLRNIDLHIIAGLFLLKSLEIKDFNNIYKLLKNYSNETIKKDKNLNNNKIFTKSIGAWKYLESKLKN